ncbi:hypothetical protein S245_036562, partial [Arachis hypogaea]
DKWTDMSGLMKRQGGLSLKEEELMQKQGVRLYTPRKSFPFYTCLKKIFCKERANGNAVVCSNDAEEENKQGNKPYSSKAAKDTKMMELTDTLKY